MNLSTAKKLRINQTEAEKKLWAHLRNKQLLGHKFRRQVSMGAYVPDFVCHERRLVVEIDGGQHADSTTEDANRTKWFESQGYKVIRFWNNEVLSNLDGVLEAISQKVK